MHTLNVSPLSATITQLQSLQAPAISIEVAAVNNVGIRVYSKPLKVVLPQIGKCLCSDILIFFLKSFFKDISNLFTSSKCSL